MLGDNFGRSSLSGSRTEFKVGRRRKTWVVCRGGKILVRARGRGFCKSYSSGRKWDDGAR